MPALLMTLAAPAWACEQTRLPEPYLTEERAEDTSPPSAPVVEAVDIVLVRGDGDGCDRCPDLVVVTLVFGDTADDLTPPEEMGYRLRVVGGELPPELPLPPGPFGGPVAQLRYEVDPELLGGGLFVQLEVSSVDRAGNVSFGTVEVEIEQPPVSVPFTCRHVDPVRASWLLGVSALALRRRRHRD